MTTGRGRLRGGLAAGAALLIATATVSPVLASAPDNDDIGSPRAISDIPYSDGPYDTTEATSGAGDPPFCYGGELGDGATVWYSFTAGDSTRLQADTIGSDYDTTLYLGTPDGEGGIAVIACNDDTFGLQSAVAWDAVAGTTYLLVVGTCCGGAGEPGGGGNLVFNLGLAPPPPEISTSVNPTGRFTSLGNAVITGTLTCTGLTNVDLEVSLRQRVGRTTISGYGYTQIECTGGPDAWVVVIHGENGRFAGGQAEVTASAFGCGASGCVFDEAAGTVRLRR